MNENLITVTGNGSIHVVPDVTRVDLTLESIHQTYEEAYAQAKIDNERLLRIMQEVSLEETLPKTIRLDIEKNIQKEYDNYGHYKCEHFIGFELNHLIRIDLTMDNVLLNNIIKLIGKFLKQAEISIGYTVRDPRPFQLKMLERAVHDAKEKATIMAHACNCTLGSVKDINYSVQELHIYAQARMIHGAEEAVCCNPESLDITPEDLCASDNVTVVWYLNNKLSKE